MDVRLPDGTVIKGVPDGMSKADLTEKLRSNGYDVSKLAEPKQPSMLDNIKQGAADLVGGAVRGAGSIGATLLYPIDKAQDLYYGDRSPTITGLVTGKQPLSRNEERRQGIDQGLTSLMGSNPDSLLYKGGKLAGEIAGTAGTGGLLAKGAQAAGAAPSVVNALASSGFTSGATPSTFAAKAGDLALRVGAGAATGGASAGLVNPEEAGRGAVVGAVVPSILQAGGKVLQIGGTVGKKLVGATTGVGDEALSQAYQAGKKGGTAAEAFTKNMRGEANMDDVLATAKQNLASIGQQRQQAYRNGMQNIKSDKTVLDFKGIDDAISHAKNIVNFNGQAKNVKAAEALQDAAEEVNKWKTLDPATFHTPEGLDALKQRVGGILESIPYEQKQARLAVGGLYNSIKSSINSQAPEYASVMKAYSEGSDLISEIERSLSLGKKASADTAMRKLQSLMRNNVNTNYGQRTALAQKLEELGGKEIMPAIAGQALNDWTPRGIQRATAGGGTAALTLMGNPVAGAGLGAASSPRLMGEAFYGAGKAAGKVGEKISPEMLDLLKYGIIRSAPVISAQ